ncbi:MAG: hypothetical protein ABIP20_02065 [Chthoniobacteraceae bacterium]
MRILRAEHRRWIEAGVDFEKTLQTQAALGRQRGHIVQHAINAEADADRFRERSQMQSAPQLSIFHHASEQYSKSSRIKAHDQGGKKGRASSIRMRG